MIRPTIGETIRELREAKGWTQKDLAERSKLSKAMISALERGDVNCTVAALRKVAEALGTELLITMETDSLLLDLTPQSIEARGLLFALAGLLPHLSSDERRSLELLVYGLEVVHLQ